MNSPQKLADFPSEAQIIARISERIPRRRDLLGLGIGDDCELLMRYYNLATADCFVEGVHFDLRWMTLQDVAYRGLSANISDIAAMGGEPGAFLLSLGLPSRRFSLDDIDMFLEGLSACVADHGLTGCVLAGGDVVRSPQSLFFNISMLGTVDAARMLTRNGARVGDVLMVFGSLGHSALGMQLLAQNIREQRFAAYYDAFCRPRAQTVMGPSLVGIAHAMMDLSDGLWRDSSKLLVQSGVGARLELESIEFSEVELEAARMLGFNILDLALEGGEDFSLLAAVEPTRVSEAVELARHNKVRAHVVGKCIEAQSLSCYYHAQEFRPRWVGFEHFN